jgi:cytolysin (calcineurin-like family phosphatase)
MTLTQILNTSAEAANLQPQDQAALELARIYAEHIQIAVIKREAKTVGDLGAKLLNVLTALGMTQAGRAVKAEIKGGGVNGVKTTSALQQLRANSANRQRTP